MAPSSSPSLFSIEVSSNFNFEGSIRSYGFFLLAPNYYNRDQHTFSRPLQVDKKVVHVEISCSKNSQSNSGQLLTVKTDKNVSTKEQAELKKQISRILRLEASYMEDFHGIFPTAKALGYGRLFRSPTLYEDIVKTMTNVNTTFARTQTMNTLICQHYGTEGSFPSPSTLGGVPPEELQKNCSVGYRGGRIVTFARGVAEGKIDMDAMEVLAEKYLLSKRSGNEAAVVLEALKKRLLSIHGFGEFSANNILQLLGKIKIDIRDHHKINLKNAKDIHNEVQKLYAKYEPFQFLVYWFNLYDFTQRFNKGFILELATPPPPSSSTTSTVSSTTTTKTKRERGEAKGRGKKRTTVDEPDSFIEESPRRSKRLSAQKL